MSDRGRFEHASRVMHHGRHCSTCTQFYESGGVVHPIRNSPGYDPSIERDTREERARHAQQERYRGVHRERGSAVVERPPWAAGLTERHLITIARAHGTNAGTPLWWEKAGLTGSVKADPRLNQRAEKVSGELRYALEGRTVDRRGTAEGARTIERRVTAGERAAARRVAIASATGGSDLPF